MHLSNLACLIQPSQGEGQVTSRAHAVIEYEKVDQLRLFERRTNEILILDCNFSYPLFLKLGQIIPFKEIMPTENNSVLDVSLSCIN